LRDDLLNKADSSPEEFVNYQLEILGKHATLLMIPLFISSITQGSKYSGLVLRLDALYMQLINALPRRSNGLLSSSTTCGALLASLKACFEHEICRRIREMQVTVVSRKELTIERTRIIQLQEIVKRITVSEMCRLKQATSFGVNGDTIQLVLSQVYSAP